MFLCTMSQSVCVCVGGTYPCWLPGQMLPERMKWMLVVAGTKKVADDAAVVAVVAAFCRQMLVS